MMSSHVMHLSSDSYVDVDACRMWYYEMWFYDALVMAVGFLKTIQTSNKNFILRCRDGKRTETRIGMEGICITHSCIPLYTVYMQHILAHSGGMQEWVIQIPSIVSVLFPSLHMKYFRIKFLLLVDSYKTHSRHTVSCTETISAQYRHAYKSMYVL